MNNENPVTTTAATAMPVAIDINDRPDLMEGSLIADLYHAEELAIKIKAALREAGVEEIDVFDFHVSVKEGLQVRRVKR